MLTYKKIFIQYKFGVLWVLILPLDFTLTKEQLDLQQKARKFAIKEVIPVSRKHDLSAEFLTNHQT